MTDRVIVKGWRGRQEEFRAELRDRLWTEAEVVGLKYDDAFEYGGVVMKFDQATRDQLKRLGYQAEWQRRKDDPVYLAKQRKAHTAWRHADPANQAKCNASASAWQKANPDKVNAKAARYRASRGLQLAIYNQLLRLSKGVSGA